MGFYGPEPFDTAQATYVWTGLGTPGFFSVTVEGHAPNFTSGIKLVRDEQWVGGLAIRVMGWTGPLGKGTTPREEWPRSADGGLAMVTHPLDVGRLAAEAKH